LFNIFQWFEYTSIKVSETRFKRKNFGWLTKF
jgi:hypothetical protein